MPKKPLLVTQNLKIVSPDRGDVYQDESDRNNVYETIKAASDDMTPEAGVISESKRKIFVFDEPNMPFPNIPTAEVAFFGGGGSGQRLVGIQALYFSGGDCTLTLPIYNVNPASWANASITKSKVATGVYRLKPSALWQPEWLKYLGGYDGLNGSILTIAIPTYNMELGMKTIPTLCAFFSWDEFDTEYSLMLQSQVAGVDTDIEDGVRVVLYMYKTAEQLILPFA